MALLNDEIINNVKEMLANIPNPVKLAVFTDDQNCEYCPQIVQLLDEVAATSEMLSVDKYEIHKDSTKANELNVEMAPAIAILGERDYGLRFYGIPSGYEFSTLLHGIQRASSGTSELDDQTKYYLAGISQPVELQVFVTPTCPYCPRAAVLAMDMAVENQLINAEIVEASEFPDLANKFNVMGVPLNVVNGTERVEGAAPPQMIIDAIRKVLS
jgi:glutaredoxin-like protein